MWEAVAAARPALLRLPTSRANKITNEGSREGASVTEPAGTSAEWEGTTIAEAVEGGSRREVVQRWDGKCEEEEGKKREG